jgi:hypothetical protein
LPANGCSSSGHVGHTIPPTAHGACNGELECCLESNRGRLLARKISLHFKRRQFKLKVAIQGNNKEDPVFSFIEFWGRKIVPLE